MSISCLDCGFVFADEAHNEACPRCGSRNRGVTLTAEIKPQGLLKLGKRGAMPKKHKHKFDKEVVTGKKIGKDGRLVSIERVIDREQDAYKETVSDEQGQTEIEKNEKLSEHH
jgi:predicted  nucleic acid-binding Zn-ribbon protein